MKESCKPGIKKTRRVTVDEARVTRHMDGKTGVYGTPFLVRDIESLCHDLLVEHLDNGEGSVGTRVDVRHLAATPEGLWVELTATVTEVDRRAVTFSVQGRDAMEEIASCTHSRFVVDLDKIKERLTAKIAKAEGL
jgi:fluoroacetyl-CoA thioesterase